MAGRWTLTAQITFLVLVVCSTLAPSESWAARDSELDAAVADRDVDAIVQRMSVLASKQPELAVEVIPKAYAKVEALDSSEMYAGERYKVFVRAIGALAKIRQPAHIEKLKKYLKKNKEWQARFLIVNASVNSTSMSSFEFCMIGLKDKHPLVVASAATALGKSKKIESILPLIVAMDKWETQAVKSKVGKGRERVGSKLEGRAWLACRDGLHRLTGQSLHSHQDYRNYWSFHREKIDPTKVDIDKESEKEDEHKTALLFGLEVTGKNIAFVLDISGSMNQTDPLTPEDEARLAKRRTAVAGEDTLLKELLEKRRRIKRARKQLTAVIKSLSDDRNFNVICYSTNVDEWQSQLKPATKKNRDSAVDYLADVKAKGVTVTDDALARAFEDPAVDTIYLITDGAPTHIGMQGEELPPDAKKLMKRIENETKVRNYMRNVRIFTLGFEGAEEEFLKKLSGKHRGRYVRIK